MKSIRKITARNYKLTRCEFSGIPQPAMCWNCIVTADDNGVDVEQGQKSIGVFTDVGILSVIDFRVGQITRTVPAEPNEKPSIIINLFSDGAPCGPIINEFRENPDAVLSGDEAVLYL